MRSLMKFLFAGVLGCASVGPTSPATPAATKRVASEGSRPQHELESLIRGSDAPGQRLVDDFRKSVGKTFAECGERLCIELGSCKPSHWAWSHSTIEGTPVRFDLFVVEIENECKVVEFADLSGDYWGDCKISKRVCPSLMAAMSSDPSGVRCAEMEILFRQVPCENPMESLFRELVEDAKRRQEQQK
ncbi:MAG: hypothetical protein QM765_28630 [Myxococcales bacterium]